MHKSNNKYKQFLATISSTVLLALLTSPTFAMSQCPHPFDRMGDLTDSDNIYYPDTDTRKQSIDDREAPENYDCAVWGMFDVWAQLLSSSSAPTTATQHSTEQSEISTEEKERLDYVKESFDQIRVDISRGNGEALNTYAHLSKIPVIYAVTAGQACLNDPNCDLLIYLVLLK